MSAKADNRPSKARHFQCWGGRPAAVAYDGGLVSRFVFPTDNKKEEFFLNIARWMTLVLDVSESEAIGRINQWSEQAMEFIDPPVVYRYSIGYLARTIFYGRPVLLKDLLDPSLPVSYNA